MTKLSGSALKRARLVPSAVFASPEAVLQSKALSRAQKVEILRRWEFDLRSPEQGGVPLGQAPDHATLRFELERALAALAAEAPVAGTAMVGDPALIASRRGSDRRAQPRNSSS